MKSDEIWKHIHAERAQMADTWTTLSPAQWAAQSWCQGWSVQDTAGHILAAAEQTPPHFYQELISAGLPVQRLHRPGGQAAGRHRPG